MIAQTPEFSWALKAGGAGVQEGGSSVATDAFGNIIVTGSFEGVATFGTTVLTSAGGRDIFIAKYNKSGKLVWAERAGGSSNDDGYDVAVDGLGNIYITGKFENTANFGTISLNSIDHADMFIAKYDSSGNVMWAKRAGGSRGAQGNGIAVDKMGDSIVTGRFSGTSTFDTVTLVSDGSWPDIFIAKYNDSGELIWVRQAGGSNYDQGFDIVFDSFGNSIITGQFYETASFDNIKISSAGYNDIFIAKYNSFGDAVWAKRAGGTEYDMGSAVAVDDLGNIIVCGSFFGNASFGSIMISSAGLRDIFIAKYDSSGDLFWVKNAGGIEKDDVRSITIGDSSDYIITGKFEGTISYSTSTLISTGKDDVFVAKYDAAGNVQWAIRAGGDEGDGGNGIVSIGSGNYVVTGTFGSVAYFDSIKIYSAGDWDIFIARLNENILLNPSFESGDLTNWETENYNNSLFNIVDDCAQGNFSLNIKIGNISEHWHTQLKQLIPVKKQTRYELSFYAKASSERIIQFSLHKDNDPYTWYGMWLEQKLTTEWQKYDLSFVCNSTDSLARFAVTFGDQKPDVWIDGFTLNEVGPAPPGKTVLFRVTNGEKILISGDRPLPANATFGFYGNDNIVKYVTPRSTHFKIPQTSTTSPFTNYWIQGDEDFFNSNYYSLEGGGHEFYYNQTTGVTDAKLFTDNSLLKNGGFESGDTHEWSIEDHFGNAFYTVGTDSKDRNHSLEIIPNNVAEDYTLQLVQDIPVKSDSAYNVSFWAKSDNNRTIVASLTRNESPWDSYGLCFQTDINQEWCFFDTTFICTEYDSLAKFSFYFGDNTSKVYIDGIKFIPVTKASIHPPVADFTAEPLTGEPPLEVQFTDKSTGEIQNWLWDFGDSGFSTDQNPTHIYRKDGKYSVTLIVTGLGGSDTLTVNDYIHCKSEILVSIPDTSGYKGQLISLPIIIGDITGKNVISYEFKLNYSSSVLSAIGANAEGCLTENWGAPNVIADNPGEIQVGSYTGLVPIEGSGTLVKILFEVIGNPGDSTILDFNYFEFNAGEPIVQTTKSIFIAEDVKPIADFTAEPLYGTPPLEVEFTDKSTGNIQNWFWDFGDSSFSTDQNPSHVYIKDGKYSVTLIIENLGSSDTLEVIDYIHCSSKVIVSIPDTSTNKGRLISIPIIIGDVTGKQVISYELILDYSSTILNAVGATADDCLTENWGAPMVTTDNLGEIRIGSYTGLDPIEGSGALVKIKFEVIGNRGDSTALNFNFFEFNAGEPVSETFNSVFFVRSQTNADEFSVAEEIRDFSLSQNYPNPFNPTTQINFDLPKADKIILEIYNLRGQKVRTLLDGSKEAGSHSIQFDATDEKGNKLPTGIYLYLFKTNEYQEIRKLTIMK